MEKCSYEKFQMVSKKHKLAAGMQKLSASNQPKKSMNFQSMDKMLMAGKNKSNKQLIAAGVTLHKSSSSSKSSKQLLNQQTGGTMAQIYSNPIAQVIVEERKEENDGSEQGNRYVNEQKKLASPQRCESDLSIYHWDIDEGVCQQGINRAVDYSSSTSAKPVNPVNPKLQLPVAASAA